MAPKAILFDLDGTLADTLEGIAWSMNHTLDQFGLPTHPVDAYRRFIGNGVRKLVERALPPGEADRLDEVMAAYMPLLESKGAEMSTAYDGIDAMLGGLAQREVSTAVLSNKPHQATVDVVRHLFPGHRFTAVRGHVDGTPVKPDPTSAHEVLDELGVGPADAWYVGDSDVDMQLAHRAGLLAVGAAWGLRGRDELLAHGARHVIGRPRDLIDLLDGG